MLSKEELQQLGYEINPDPDQPGRFLWRNDQEGSDTSYDSEREAILAANRDAAGVFDLYRCISCGKVHNDQTMIANARAGDPSAHAGGCPDCGGSCNEIRYPEWREVVTFFGLDESFQYSAEDVMNYTIQYSKACTDMAHNEVAAARAMTFVRKVSELMKPGELNEEGQPFEPSDGLDDSHSCLMDLIDDARLIMSSSTALNLDGAVRVRPVALNGEWDEWRITQNLTDRWGDINWYDHESKSFSPLLTTPGLLNSLREQMWDEITFVVRKDGQFGLLFEVEYCSKESEQLVGNSDSTNYRPHDEVVKALLILGQKLQSDYPGVAVAVPDEDQIVQNRPALWVFVPNGLLSSDQRESLGKAMLAG